MVRIFKTIEGAIHEIQEPQEDCWIAMTNPTATEIFEMSERFGIEVDDLRAPLDEEERARIEVEDNYTLILVDVPMIEERNDKDWYSPWYYRYQEDDLYGMSGRYSGTHQIYGGKGT